MIIDINFGHGACRDGFFALSQIRDMGINALVCLHSDAPVITYQKKALLAGPIFA